MAKWPVRPYSQGELPNGRGWSPKIDLTSCALVFLPNPKKPFKIPIPLVINSDRSTGPVYDLNLGNGC